MRHLADLRRRLPAAEDALADALATMKRAEEAYDAADDRFTAAENALDAAREDRAQARRARYAARQAHDQASTAVDRLQRRVRDLAERLDQAAEQGPPSHLTARCMRHLPARQRTAPWLSLCLIHPRHRPFISGHRPLARTGQERSRTVVNGGAQYSKA
jgi:hypothetical protein